jgi:hypothetical protein
MWHIDTTVIRLLDGTRVYLHAVIDNFSRRILAWRVADTFAPVNSVAVLVEASRGATPSETTPVVLADAGTENVNAQVDALISTRFVRDAAECAAGVVRETRADFIGRNTPVRFRHAEHTKKSRLRRQYSV